MAQPRFELLDHTADIGALAYGRTLPEAFENAALAMFSVMADLSTVGEKEVRDIEVEGDSPEELLVAWLSELLYLSDTQQMVFRRFAIDQMDHHLRGQAWGEPIDRDRHALGSGVKAVTRHLLAIDEKEGLHRIQVIFDI